MSTPRYTPKAKGATPSLLATVVTKNSLDHRLDSLHTSPAHLLGLQDDEQFVPAFEMEDAADSDHAEKSD